MLLVASWRNPIYHLIIRIKEEAHQSHENNGNHGRGVFASGRKWTLGGKKGNETPPSQRITRADCDNVFANLWNGQRVTETVHAGRGPEIKWENPIKLCSACIISQ